MASDLTGTPNRNPVDMPSPARSPTVSCGQQEMFVLSTLPAWRIYPAVESMYNRASPSGQWPG